MMEKILIPQLLGSTWILRSTHFIFPTKCLFSGKGCFGNHALEKIFHDRERKINAVRRSHINTEFASSLEIFMID
jgi:hypothetical protein